MTDQQATEREVMPEGMISDYITGKPVKENDKETARQQLARAIVQEFGISVADMAPDFPIPVGGKRRKADLVIFSHGAEHVPENVTRIVIIKKEPAKKGAGILRSHEQANKDLAELEELLEAAPHARYGMWTNGLEWFFLEAQRTPFETTFEPIADWPMADESLGTQNFASVQKVRKADKQMLQTTFRRCHNFIHGNEGMPKDKAFWQFLYLIYTKMFDEQSSRMNRRFFTGAREPFTPEGQKAIRARILPIFEQVKKEHGGIFGDSDQITLSDRALAFMVSELGRYELSRADIDAKGAAYQEIVGDNLRGDRGQYFTPRGPIKLLVDILNPQPHEKVLDPACGTGGFLVAVLNHISELLRAANAANLDDTEGLEDHKKALAEYATTHLFGADFDQTLVRATSMNVVMSSSARATPHIFHINSLEFPKGHLSGVPDAIKHVPLGSVDVLMANPPFGSDIPITEKSILEQYDLAHTWEKLPDGNYKRTTRLQSAVAPEVLFVERCIKWVRPGGRLGLVLPDGILGNPGDEYIRWWIMQHCYVLASVDLPVETFIVEANVNILTSLLVMKRKTSAELQAEALGKTTEYPVFMAVAENVGFDRRGNTLYKRQPDGEEIWITETDEEDVKTKQGIVKRQVTRRRKIIDDDLPEIAKKYREFRQLHPEPGA